MTYIESIKKYAINNCLEIIFPECHKLFDRIFYDRKEGKYYDRYTDFYLTIKEYELIKG